MKINFYTKGQSLIEIIIAITIGGMIIGISSGAIVVTLRVNMESRATRIASTLIQELSDNVRALAKSSWYALYATPSKTLADPYHLEQGSPLFQITPGTESSAANNLNFVRRFYIENVCRSNDSSATLQDVAPCTPGAEVDDPSTQKITVAVDWVRGGATKTTQSVFYLTRTRNYFAKFSDWSGGPRNLVTLSEPDNTFSNEAGSGAGVTYSTAGTLTGSGYLFSHIFDTGATDGAAFNSILFLGSTGAGVSFQIASSGCENGAKNPPTCTDTPGWGAPKTEGAGAFVGSDGFSTSSYAVTPDVQVPLKLSYHNNHRYVRYKVSLAGGGSQVNDVILSWSP